MVFALISIKDKYLTLISLLEIEVNFRINRKGGLEMLTTTGRPATFDEVAGQKLPKQILRSIINNPENAPKTMILQGPFGTGKTTLTRIFSRALNCESGKGYPCMKCKSCLEPIMMSPFYSEYDSSIIGKVDKIKEIRDTFYVSSQNGWNVRVFDEVHLISSQAQGALLKILEEPPKRTFFLLATTDPQKIIKTIVSRSLEINFELVNSENMKENLLSLANKSEISVDEEVISLIIKKARGHMRDAHKYLDQYSMVGKDSFQELFVSCVDSYIRYFKAISKGNKELVFQAIQEIITYPLAESKFDYELVVNNISKQMVGVINDPVYDEIVRSLGTDVLKLIKVCISDWVLDGFTSDMELSTTLLCVFQMLAARPTPVVSSEPVNRAARR